MSKEASDERDNRDRLRAEAELLHPGKVGVYMGVQFVSSAVCDQLGIPTKVVPPGVRIVDVEAWRRHREQRDE